MGPRQDIEERETNQLPRFTAQPQPVSLYIHLHRNDKKEEKKEDSKGQANRRGQHGSRLGRQTKRPKAVRAGTGLLRNTRRRKKKTRKREEKGGKEKKRKEKKSKDFADIRIVIVCYQGEKLRTLQP